MNQKLRTQITSTTVFLLFFFRIRIPPVALPRFFGFVAGYFVDRLQTQKCHTVKIQPVAMSFIENLREVLQHEHLAPQHMRERQCKLSSHDTLILCKLASYLCYYTKTSYLHEPCCRRQAFVNGKLTYERTETGDEQALSEFCSWTCGVSISI